MHPIRTLAKAIRHPGTAVVRLTLLSRIARAPADGERGRLLAFLSHHFGLDAAALHDEYLRGDFSRWYRARRAELERFRGPYRTGTTDAFGLEALYLIVRASRPQVVVETGVLYGASSGHILAALVTNGRGELHSVEIGREPDEPPHDFFVPDDLKPRWELIIGDSAIELPSLFARLPPVDLFHHDSLHTFEHMTWEYTTALPHLSPRGVLSTDDVLRPHSARELFRRNAFLLFCEQHSLQGATFRNIGMALGSDRIRSGEA